MGIFLYVILLCYISSDFCTLADVQTHENHSHRFMSCRHCGAKLGDSTFMFTKPSPGAVKFENRTEFGKNVTVQTLINPFHTVFEVVTTSKASCDNYGRTIRGDSWFPGYSWRVCACPKCAAQLGWTFERTLSNDVVDTNVNETFHALILSRLFEKKSDPQVTTLPTTLLSKDLITAVYPRASEATATSLHKTTTLMALIYPREAESIPAPLTSITPTTKNVMTSIATTLRDKQIITTPFNITSATAVPIAALPKNAKI